MPAAGGGQGKQECSNANPLTVCEMSLQRMSTFWGNSDYQSFLGRLLGSSFWVPRQRENRDGGACLFSLWKKRFLLNCLLSCLSRPCMCNAAFSNTCTLPKAICFRKSFHIAHAVSVHSDKPFSDKPFPLPFIPPLAGYRQESVLSLRSATRRANSQVKSAADKLTAFFMSLRRRRSCICQRPYFRF